MLISQIMSQNYWKTMGQAEIILLEENSVIIMFFMAALSHGDLPRLYDGVLRV